MTNLTPVPGATPRYDDTGREVVDIATCGTCGRSWNDAAVSGLTPAPSGRCPFEYEHERMTIENGVERDVREATDFRCDECSTDTMEIWHEHHREESWCYHDAPGLAPGDRCECGEVIPPIVFIGVEGGVADWTEVGNVAVHVIDWDEVEENPEYARDKLDEFHDPRLRSLLNEASRHALAEAAEMGPPPLQRG